MDRLNPKARRDEYGSRINRTHSPALAQIIPPVTVMFMSLLPAFVLTGSVPMMPPLGLMILLAWRIARPGMFPVWIGFPLGLFDDLFSGQPFGSAMLLWSLAMIGIELIEARFPWRSYMQDWMTMGAIIAIYLLAAAVLSGAAVSVPMLIALCPQFLIALLLLPVVSRLVAIFDRLRLRRVRVVRT